MSLISSSFGTEGVGVVVETSTVSSDNNATLVEIIAYGTEHLVIAVGYFVVLMFCGCILLFNYGLLCCCCYFEEVDDEEGGNTEKEKEKKGKKGKKKDLEEEVSEFEKLLERRIQKKLKIQQKKREAKKKGRTFVDLNRHKKRLKFGLSRNLEFKGFEIKLLVWICLQQISRASQHSLLAVFDYIQLEIREIDQLNYFIEFLDFSSDVLFFLVYFSLCVYWFEQLLVFKKYDMKKWKKEINFFYYLVLSMLFVISGFIYLICLWSTNITPDSLVYRSILQVYDVVIDLGVIIVMLVIGVYLVNQYSRRFVSIPNKRFLTKTALITVVSTCLYVFLVFINFVIYLYSCIFFMIADNYICYFEYEDITIGINAFFELLCSVLLVWLLIPERCLKRITNPCMTYFAPKKNKVIIEEDDKKKITKPLLIFEKKDKYDYGTIETPRVDPKGQNDSYWDVGSPSNDNNDSSSQSEPESEEETVNIAHETFG